MATPLKSGDLWAALIARTQSALRGGALLPVPTESACVEQDGICFVVRLLASVARKHEALRKQPADFNPFLPYDPDLFVADLSSTHVALLNKYNVVDHHLLIVTRRFEEQDSLLTLQDFAALAVCMAAVASLAFYNAGTVAGASQRHKHLQLVPLPLVPGGPPVPIEPALAAARFRDPIGSVPVFPFAHALVRLDELTADRLLDRYCLLRDVLGCAANTPYNLLATRQWMLLVPRRCEHWAPSPGARGISVNALGFAGSLLVRNQEQLRLVRQRGPMEILRQVAVPV